MFRSLFARLFSLTPTHAAIAVGDLVQWDQNGILQLQKPTPVKWISECRGWVVVEGSNTGLPMAEIVRVYTVKGG